MNENRLGPRAPADWSLPQEAIKAELLNQSYIIFGVVGLGGSTGPSKDEFDRYRPDRWPYSDVLLRRFGLPPNAAGWTQFLNAFGFTAPTQREIQSTAYRRREAGPTSPSIPDHDESYPTLEGTVVHITHLHIIISLR